ncbi:MAG: aminotransferase class V-fold PLP-dependent enzyme [Bacteroidales bacterium]|nr:aminotransferase class V-fold PLP-dependent enzyme [Bacteroidales bacterium]
MSSNTYSAPCKESASSDFTLPDHNDVFSQLEHSVYAALETYSNVHRGSGHNSMVTTHLYEQAREIVLEYLGVDKYNYMVIFCSGRRSEKLKAKLKPLDYQSISSQEIGLPLGITAMAVKRNKLTGNNTFETGGGTARLVSPDRVTWAKAPDRFEAGTPAIINAIAFARALKLIREYGYYAFHDAIKQPVAADSILKRDKLEAYTGHELLGKLRETLLGLNTFVPTREGKEVFVNLDNAASTPTFSPVWDAFRKTLSQPRPAQQEIIHLTKSICAQAMGASLREYDVIFTSNTTEAVNLVAESLGLESTPEMEPVVLNTIMEHTSNELPWRMTPGISMISAKTDEEGFIDLVEMEQLLRAYNQEKRYANRHISLVAVSGASNVLGTCNDLPGISMLVHKYGARLLVDAAQLVAHRKVEIEQSGIDFLACSAHKVYAPFGTGVLIARKGLLSYTSTESELIRSSGEENAAGIAAFGKALVLMQRIGLDLIQQEEQELTAYALQSMSQIPGLKILGINNPDSHSFKNKSGVIAFDLKGKIAVTVAEKLAEFHGIGVRYGCHCAHIMVKHLLKIPPFAARLQHIMLFLLPKLSLPGITRISLGIENSKKDIERLVSALKYMNLKPDGKKTRTQPSHQQQLNEFMMGISIKVYGGRSELKPKN